MGKIYILKSEMLVESVEVSYTNGQLDSVTFPIKNPVTPKQYTYLMTHIPYSEEMLEFNMKHIKIQIQEALPTNLKISLFCRKYMEYKNGLKYKVMPADTGKVKLIKVDEGILDAYFKSQAFEFVGKDGAGKHSISNLMTYYNLLLQEMSATPKGKYPDHWSEAFEGKLSQIEVPKYWAHLRGLGLQPKKDRVGKTTDWVKMAK